MTLVAEEIVKCPAQYDLSSLQGKVTWESPSNIALVKYWGKKEVQIPCNPSVSFTLRDACTTTTLEYAPKAGSEQKVQFFLDQEEKPSFVPKILKFIERIAEWSPFVKDLDFKIYSSNTFPHSAGIASSASGMSALALCICSIEEQINEALQNEDAFYRKASHLARLGSGSACRSLYGGLVNWGKSQYIDGSSDLYGTDVTDQVHDVFKTYRDTILIVDKAEKKVSSTIGHGLMDNNPFSEQRFQQAEDNMGKIMNILKSGDEEAFIKIVESEALTLHAMMMTSDPYYLLMRPNTLKIIEKLFAFREDTKIPVGFTLDAGPNVHVLYPEHSENQVKNFIDTELKQLLHDFCYLTDQVGSGPRKKPI